MQHDNHSGGQLQQVVFPTCLVVSIFNNDPVGQGLSTYFGEYNVVLTNKTDDQCEHFSTDWQLMAAVCQEMQQSNAAMKKKTTNKQTWVWTKYNLKY